VCCKELWKHQQKNIEEWLQSDACELGFQHMTNGIISAAMKEKGGEDGSEIHTACEEESKQFTKASDHYIVFLKITLVVKKNCDILWTHQTEYFGLSVLLFVHHLPFITFDNLVFTVYSYHLTVPNFGEQC
jgi:hypothetical protein